MKFFINYPFGNIEIEARHRSKKLFALSTERGFNSKKIIETCLSKREPIKCIPYIERIEQSSHNHYSICFCMMMEQAAKIDVDYDVQIIRTIILELERIYSHTIYLNRLFFFSSNDSLINHTHTIKDSLLDCSEEITGHRMYGTGHIFGETGFNISAGNIKLINKVVDETKSIINKIKKLTDGNITLISIFKGLATINNTEMLTHKMTGPFSWISQTNTDLRVSSPYLAYVEKEIAEILKSKYTTTENSVYSRIWSIIHDIENSLNIIKFLLSKYMPRHQRKSMSEQPKFIKGFYVSKIESPRGIIEMSVDIHKEGHISDLKIISPSDVNKKILNSSLRGTYIDYTQVAFESLYLSMMEIDK